MTLSEHFELSEFTLSQTASRLRIDNNPPSHVLAKLGTTAQGLELVRTLLGNKPINISSGYRSPHLNAAVKGAKDSQHQFGEAVDFTCPAFGTPAQIVAAIVASDIRYDQVIQEFSSGNGGWVHISFSPRQRLQALIIDASGARVYA